MMRDWRELTRVSDVFDPIPWMVLGIFPTEDGPPHDYDWFNYTVGATENDVWDLWCPAISIEGRHAGNELIGWVLNGLVTGLRLGEIWFGDDVKVPFGVPDGDDVDCVFWVGSPEVRDPDSRMACYRTSSTLIVPIRWSSALGWPE